MATITPQDIPLSSAGIVVTFTGASGGGDQFANPGGTYHLRIKNASGAQRTVTIPFQVVCNHGFNHNLVVVVSDGDTEEVGPFPPDRFNDSSGFVQLTYDNATGVSVAVVDGT